YRHDSETHQGRDLSTASDYEGDRRGIRRTDGLPDHRPADVRALDPTFVRAVPAQHQLDRAEQRDPPRNESALHRVVHGRPESRVRARIALARVPNRSARLYLSAILGRTRLLRYRGPRSRSAQGKTARHSAVTQVVEDLGARIARQPRGRWRERGRARA